MKQITKRGLALLLVLLLCLSLGDVPALAEGLEALYAQVFAQAETLEEAMELGESLGLGGSASEPAPAFKLLRPEEDDSRIELLAPASDEGVQATSTAVDVNSVTWSVGPNTLGTSSTVNWGITSDGTLVIYPANGTSGSCTLNITGSSNSPFINYYSSIKKVVVNPGVAVSGKASFLFCGLDNVTEMDLSGLDTSNVTSMYGMFNDCRALTSLDVSHFNTANVTIMTNMFSGCSALTSLDVSHFNTANVTSMDSMFYCCSRLTSLDLSSFNTANAYMSDMFYGCSALREVRLGENFRFKNTSSGRLPYPPSGRTTGKWIREDGAYGPYTPADLATEYNANPAALAGTWVWEMLPYTLRFNSKGGTGEMAGVKAAPGASLTLPPCTFINDGYEFLGWARSSTATTPDYADGATLPTGYPGAQANRIYTLYALWQVTTEYTLQLTDGSGASLTLGRYEAAQDAAITTTGTEFSRLGQTIAGWKDENSGAEYGLSFTIPAGTYAAGTRPVLTAIWRKPEYTATPTDGVYTITLRGGEKAVITGLPAGVSYQIWEDDTPAGWSMTGQENSSGKIVEAQEKTASFTNQFAPGQTGVQLIGVTTLDGQAPSEGAFRFELSGGLLTEPVTVTNDGSGFIVLPMQSFVYDTTLSYPVEYTFTVRELAGEQDWIVYDTHSETVTVTISHDPATNNLSAAVSYDGDGLKFENRSRPGGLQIAKIGEGVTAANADDVFTFRIRLSNDSGPLADGGASIPWYVQNAETGQIVSGG